MRFIEHCVSNSHAKNREMGVAGSKPNTNKRLTRKASSSPKYPPSPRSNRKTSSNRSSFSQVYFDPALPIWTKRIQPALVGRERAIFYFAESAAPGILVSHKVFRWFDSHWYDLTDFCQGQLDTERARLRFRYVKTNINMEREYGANFNYSAGRPRTESPRFERFVEYADNTIALCIRADGLVEGFAILDADDDSLKVDVICVGPKKTGVGRIMMEDFKRFAVATGRQTIELTAVPTAVGFYEKLGFSRTEEEYEEGDDVEMAWTSDTLTK